MYTHVYVSVCAGACVYMWKPEDNVRCHLRRCCPPSSSLCSEHWDSRSPSRCLTFSLRCCSLNSVLMAARPLIHGVTSPAAFALLPSGEWTLGSLCPCYGDQQSSSTLIHAWPQPPVRPYSQAFSFSKSAHTLWLGYLPLSYPSKYKKQNKNKKTPTTKRHDSGNKIPSTQTQWQCHDIKIS